jgi:hypothetical protein
MIRWWSVLAHTYDVFYWDFIYPVWFLFASWSFHASFYNTIYNKFFNSILVCSYTMVNKYLDRGLFEYFGPYGLFKLFALIRNNLFFQYNSIIFVAFMIFVMALIILISLISWTFFWCNFFFNLGLFIVFILLLIYDF